MTLETLEALAFGDRDTLPPTLVAGTEDHDAWRAIRHQHRGELDAADAILDAWPARHGRSERFETLRLRQLVLRADQDLARGALPLAETLGYGFDHPRRTAEAAPDVPSTWRLPDPASLLARGRDADRGLAGLTDEGVRALPFGRDALAHLQRLRWGGVPGLVEALAADLRRPDAKAFGALPLHRALALPELEALAAAVPALRTDREWVLERVARHRPPAHLDLDEPAVRGAWLEALWGLVADLPPALGGLRAHALWHHLAHDRRCGVTDAGRLRTWLQVPRRSPAAPARWLEGHDPRHVVAPGEDWSRWTGLPAIGDDTELVRHHLAARLLAGDTADDWVAHVDRDWLLALEAEVRLLGGDPDAERWTRRLGAAVSALRDRVDLAWCPHLPARLRRDDPVVLEADVKNAWPLAIRVFRVDVAAGFASGWRSVPFDLELDGLAPRAEEVRTHDHGPLRRTRERFALPACDEPGTWIVDLVGNGRASRALLRKGDLRASSRVGADGIEVTVLDEDGGHRPGARIRLGPVTYEPGPDGVVRLPFGSGAAVPALLLDGPLAVITAIVLPAETAALGVSALVDRQALVPGTTASILVRPHLAVAGTPIPVERLEDAWVEVTTLDRTGVPTQRRTPVSFSTDAEHVVALAVPEHLASVGVAIGGRLRIRSQQRHEVLRAEQAFPLHGQADGTDPAAIHVIPSPDGTALAVLGRTGEPCARREVAITLRHAWLRDPLVTTLATDAAGRVDLGPLPGVVQLSAHAPGAGGIGVDLRPPPLPPPAARSVEGEPVRVPWRGRWRLVALRGGSPAEVLAEGSATDGLAIVSPPAGPSRLEGDDRALDLAVVPGPRKAHGAAALPAATVRVPAPRPALAAPRIEGDALVITVADATDDTRVHVTATPTLPAPLGAPDLGAPPAPDEATAHLPARTAHASERALGDELRYVLERRAHRGRVGSLLEKPSLLLQPWALRATRTVTFDAMGGGGWAGAPPPAPAAAPAPQGPRASRPEPAAAHAAPTFDFLAEAPPTLANLRPDARGRVVVPLAALPGAVITVVCVDPAGTARAVCARPPTPLRARDRRLARALPAGVDLVESRRLAAEPGSGSTARIDELGPLYRALCALSGDATLAAWDFLPRWSTLADDDKARLWTEHACHELALFTAHRDPEWFARVVRPTLATKLEPDLVDDLLVGRDLDRWLVPWRLARLDAIERALLARARPDARGAIARRLADEVSLQRPDPSRDDRLVDVLLGGSGQSPPPPEFEGGEAFADLALDDDADEAPKTRAAAPKKKSAKADRSRAREEAAELWRAADLTKEWAEHQWWQTPRAARGPHRVPAARLWRDLAAHGDGPFLSPSLADAAASFSAAVCALAVYGVPAAPVFATATWSRAEGPPTGTVLVGQHLVRPDDRFAHEGGEEREKHVGDELVAGVVHTAVVAVTNPTPRRRRLGVLCQVPAGTIPLGGVPATRTVPLDLAPWATSTIETTFYAPHPGTFAWYGARVADGPTVAAAAPDRTLSVVAVPTTTDADSWPWISQEAPLAEVLAWLARAVPDRVTLADLAWRVRDRAAFDAITAALAARGTFDETLWSYALWHRDRIRVGELLDRLPLAARLAPLECGLLSADPTDRGVAEHLEYAPLINARAHRLGAEQSVANEGQDAHWRAFLTEVATRPEPRPVDCLRGAHHLYAMDRAEDAARLLARVRAVHASLQREWLLAYAAALSGDLDTVAALSAPHLAHPLPRWRGRFQALRGLVDEVRHGLASAGDPDRRDDRIDALAARAPALRASLVDGALVLDHANLEEAVVRVHRMDVEVAFSRAPFPGAAQDRVGLVDPSESFLVRLDPSGRTTVALPPALARVDAVLEVVAGGLRSAVTRLAHDLAVTVLAAYGQVLVRRASTQRPVAGAYVKVFARQRGGGAAFYKDGYTDPRGRFDHATLSTDDLDRAERFAILVTHEDAGTTIVEAELPPR
jgi:hypothetical protein